MNERIKVIQFIHGFTAGGAENLVKQYCILFDKNKIELLVIAIHNYHSAFDRELELNNISVVYIDDVIDKQFAIFPMLLKKLMRRIFRRSVIKKYIHLFGPDVLHYHLLLSEYVKYAHPSKKTSIYLTVHSDPMRCWNNHKKECKKDKKSVEWLIQHYNFTFITLYQEMRRMINQMFHVKNSLVINNGIQISQFLKKSENDIRNTLLCSDDSVIIGHVGRFHPVKNHNFIIDVFEQFLKIQPKAFLVLVGTGELKLEIEDKIRKKGMSDKVQLLGERSDVSDILQIMDALLFPSLSEGFPVTLIEAQIAQVPCLVSDVVTKEVKISNLIYFENLSKSSKQWAQKLNTIIGIKQSPQITSKDWDLNEIVKKIEDVYKTGRHSEADF